MGARAYILCLENGRWKVLYSHWGANAIKDHIVEGKGAFKEFLEELIKKELQKGEKWEEIESPREFIDLSAIDIEAWVIDTRKKIYIVFPFKNLEIYGAIVAEITNSYEDLATLHIYEKFNSYMDVISTGINELIDSETAKKIAIHHFFKWYFKPAQERWLVLGEKLPEDIASIIEGKVIRII